MMMVTDPAGRDQKLKMLIHVTLESHGMFAQIIKHIFSTLSKHKFAQFAEHQSGLSWSFNENAHDF